MATTTAAFLVLVIAGLAFSDGTDWRIPPHCNLPLHRGPCRAFIPSYGYNVTSGECQRFVFGGCRSNGNRFTTLSGCRRTCLGI
ncbi:unnamed protein product [Mesocestoides corti]|uniref:BPTI/Kunitz inhibitor domain-containing protein n=1 Tax=Mesocestoides corti TaxID=53468 RepID=A0A0R3U5G4_MESCO|nr:unnamed protein product [Mesocestoides corti]